MGSEPFVYEETDDGTLAYYAGFGLQSYRGFKYPWTGRPPTSEMGYFAYAKTCNSTAALYASWNGATEVARWKLFTGSSNSTTGANFILAGTSATNETFETIGMGAFGLFSYAVAYDGEGAELGQTPTVKTFVPSAQLAINCSSVACPAGTNYATAEQTTCS